MERHGIGVHIVAGFLGAGKTTFINKLFEDGLDARGTVLVENELGDEAVDDELVKGEGLSVRTLVSGCICCSLRADLAAAIEEAVGRFAPRTVLIEPTGVASPDEVARICANDLWNLPLRVESVVTVVNAQTLGELAGLEIGAFDAQLAQARLVLLSRTQLMEPRQVERAREALWEHVGWKVPVLDAPWDSLDALEVLGIAQEAFAAGAPPAAGGAGGGHGHAGAGHVHGAGEVESYVARLDGAFGREALRALSERLESGELGQVLRAKGFVRDAAGGMVHVEYAYGSAMQASPSSYAGEPKLVVIGRGLDRGAPASGLCSDFVKGGRLDAHRPQAE